MLLLIAAVCLIAGADIRIVAGVIILYLILKAD